MPFSPHPSSHKIRTVWKTISTLEQHKATFKLFHTSASSWIFTTPFFFFSLSPQVSVNGKPGTTCRVWCVQPHLSIGYGEVCSLDDGALNDLYTHTDIYTEKSQCMPAWHVQHIPVGVPGTYILLSGPTYWYIYNYRYPAQSKKEFPGDMHAYYFFFRPLTLMYVPDHMSAYFTHPNFFFFLFVAFLKSSFIIGLCRSVSVSSFFTHHDGQ